MSKQTKDASELLVERERLGRTNERAEDSRDADKRPSIPETRGLSKAELIARFRTEMFNNVLPALPDMPGYHLCWVSTTNQNDTVNHRETMGYERVKPEDLPGMEHITLTQGNFAGCIGMNEMVAMKLPTDLYQEYMRINHHERPYSEEEKIRETVRYLKDQAQDGGASVYLGDGTNEMFNSRLRREPTFSE